MGLFAKIKGAKGTEGGSYFVPGLYAVKIERCKEGKTRAEKPFFAAECKILKSNTEELKAGATASFFVLFDEYPELSLGNVADFMNAGMQAYFIQNDVEAPANFEIDEEIADDIAGEENLLAGIILEVEAYNKKTKQGADFTRFKWKVLDKAQIAALV